MTKHTITFIGLNTHKEFSEVVTINDPRDQDNVAPGRIPSQLDESSLNWLDVSNLNSRAPRHLNDPNDKKTNSDNHF